MLNSGRRVGVLKTSHLPSPLNPFGQIFGDGLFIMQVVQDSSIDLLQREAAEVLLNGFRRFAVQEAVNNGIQGDTGPFT